jgi:hypothetical protein
VRCVRRCGKGRNPSAYGGHRERKGRREEGQRVSEAEALPPFHLSPNTETHHRPYLAQGFTQLAALHTSTPSPSHPPP